MCGIISLYRFISYIHTKDLFTIYAMILLTVIFFVVINRTFIFNEVFLSHLGFPGGASSVESSCQGRRHKCGRFDLWVGRISWSRKWQPAPIFLPGKSHGQRSLAAYSPWGHKEADVTEQLSPSEPSSIFSHWRYNSTCWQDWHNLTNKNSTQATDLITWILKIPLQKEISPT